MSVVATDEELRAFDSRFDWPLFGLQDDVRPALSSARALGVDAVLATLYGVEGAAPRGVGAQMVFTEHQVTGFLSGGCIEADLALHAAEVLQHQHPLRLVYGEGGPMDIRLPCGSRIDVLLEPVGPNDPAVGRLLEYQLERRVALWLTTGEVRECIAARAAEPVDPALRLTAELAKASNRTCDYSPAPFTVFRVYAPQRRLLVIGADPIALAVVKLASAMGFDTILNRPRGPEACPLPGLRYDRSEVAAALGACRPDPWTAIAILTHDAIVEHAALTAALATQAGYVGVLGSRRRVQDRKARLVASGVKDADIARVHAPIGLPIGGKSPWEIAVSVIAEIVSELDARSPPLDAVQTEVISVRPIAQSAR